MNDDFQEICVPNAEISQPVHYSPAIDVGEEANTSLSANKTEEEEKTAAARRAKELAEWLDRVQRGDPEAWTAVPAGINHDCPTQEETGIRLQPNSLTPAQLQAPHAIFDHQRKFATEAEYQSYIERKRAWANEHYPPGVEVVPVVTAAGVKTVAIIGLTADQVNAINDAVYEKIALEQQIALGQPKENTRPLTPPEPEPDSAKTVSGITTEVEALRNAGLTEVPLDGPGSGSIPKSEPNKIRQVERY